MRKIFDVLFRLILGILILAIVGIIAIGAAFIVLDIPGAAYRLGTPDPGLNPAERFLLSSYLALNEDALLQPSGEPDYEYVLEVVEGQTARSVINNLEDAERIHRPFLFQMYLRYLGYDRGIEPGQYALNGSMSLIDIALDLQNAQPLEIHFILIPGWRIEEVAQAVASSYADMASGALVDAFRMPAIGTSFEEELPDGASLEGFLLPDTYVFSPEASPTDIAFTMLDRFDAALSPELQNGFAEQGLSLYEAVTLASIVEREAILAEEMPRIASVYLNRLAIGMNLEADPTVQYAIGVEGRWWKSPLAVVDLSVNSAYNTYIYPGLPPGPIANPSLDALQAVAFPETTPYYFFRAACDESGAHNFAETYDEHLQNACP